MGDPLNLGAVVTAFWFAFSLSSQASADRLMAGGEGSVRYHAVQPFMLPAANLPQSMKAEFFAGKALAVQPWVKAPTATDSRDGLGPLYNARSCVACHARGERGRLPESPDGFVDQAIIKLAVAGPPTPQGSVPHPVYGAQLQTQSISLRHQFRKAAPNKKDSALNEAAPEADIRITWESFPFEYPDGSVIQLRRPTPELSNLGYGTLNKTVRMSLRNTPLLYGMGLLENISEEQIVANADPADANKDGISGRVNRVWNNTQNQYALGRFGWKATKPDVPHITAAAFAHDIGITNAFFPATICTQTQVACVTLAQIKTGADLEIPDDLLDLTVHFVRNIAVPKARPLSESAQRGQALFDQLGCIACHRATYVTAANPASPHLSSQQIWPYTDMLLHDMGEALADSLPEYDAEGAEWRTPPLWGLGASKSVRKGHAYLLHDGRAQTIEHAILWHGGEAENSKQRFVALPKEQRVELLQFLESI